MQRWFGAYLAVVTRWVPKARLEVVWFGAGIAIAYNLMDFKG